MDGLSRTPLEPRSPGRRQILALRPRSVHEGEGYWIRVHRRAMACRFEVTLSGEESEHVAAARRALDEVERIEAALTVFRDTSDLVEVNRLAASQPVPLNAELFDLLRACREVHAATGGAFDVTSTPLSRCWGFLSRAGRLPSEEEIAQARANVGMGFVELDEERRTVRFARPGVELNLGSIGKGYALGRMAAVLGASGVSHALVSAAGSSVLALGGRGRGFRVDVRSRRVSRQRLFGLRLRAAALGTSGAGEQFVDVDGRRYGHVIDPRTGWPAMGVISASVVTADAAMADALSTAFLVGGRDVAERYCATHPGTLAFLTPDEASERPLIFGSHGGAAILEDA